MHRKGTFKKVLSWVALILLLVVFLFPLIWLAATALKDSYTNYGNTPAYSFLLQPCRISKTSSLHQPEQIPISVSSSG